MPPLLHVRLVQPLASQQRAPGAGLRQRVILRNNPVGVVQDQAVGRYYRSLEDIERENRENPGMQPF